MDPEQVSIIVREAVREATSGNNRQIAALRRPDLPPFDKAHIELWISRVEGAFARSCVTDPKAKFSYLDKIFTAAHDPIITRYLLGPQDAAEWTSFIAYLRKQHGRSKRVQAYSIINGTPREGRKPSALAAIMDEKAGDITLDDIKKEQLLKELPPHVRTDLSHKIKNKTFQETADLADDYFDESGKLLDPPTGSSNVSSIHHNQPTQQKRFEQQEPLEFTSAFSLDDGPDTDVNAVRFKQGQKQRFSIQNRSTSRGRSSFPSGPRNIAPRYPSSNGAPSSNFRGNSSNEVPNGKGQICKYHLTYGKDAQKCEPKCMMWSQHPLSKGKASQ